MKRSDKVVKTHIISLRISAQEWDSLLEVMKGLQVDRVSDLMREAFKLVMIPAHSCQIAAARAQKKARCDQFRQ